MGRCRPVPHRARSKRRVGSRRAEQGRAALWHEIGDGLVERFRAAPAVAGRLAEIERDVTKGVRTPAVAASLLLAAFLEEGPSS